MKVLFEEDRMDNQFKDLEYGELFKFQDKFNDIIFMKILGGSVNSAVDIQSGMVTNITCHDDDPIVRIPATLHVGCRRC